MNLNPGDPCLVRLHDGRVVDAAYNKKSMLDDGKGHSVYVGNRMYFARRKAIYTDECRFVGNPGVLEPV